MNVHYKKQGFVSAASTVVLLVLLCGCSLIPHIGHHTPVHIEQRIDAPFQPYRVEQYCINAPPIFSARLTHAAASALADRVDGLVNVNFGGLAVYVNVITHNSIQGTILNYSVPSVPSDPAPPAKPMVGNDPYQNSDVEQAYQQAFASWQAQLVENHQKLSLLASQVKKWTDRLRSLNPNQFYDPVADDLYGCLVDSSQHFNVKAEKYLIIASPLINNTLVNASGSINLSGVHVLVIYRTCDVASVCAASDGSFTKLFQQYGAISVKILDPAQSEVEKPTF